MDGIRAGKKTRSSTRSRNGNKSEELASIVTNNSKNEGNNPLDELLKEQTTDEIFLNYGVQEEDGEEQQKQQRHNSNRMVHFIGADHNISDDIPSMLIGTSNDNEKYTIASGNPSESSVMRLGFGAMNLRRDGPMELVSDGLFGHEDRLGGDDDDEDQECSGSLSFGSTSADLRAAIVSNWLTDHYEPQDNISLPRSVLYDHYLEFCHSQGTEPVNSATFGKIIRSVFPTLRTRRLGTRGNSKYHYFGIGLKTDLLGNDQYSAIYSQYSRPPPSRPRNTKKETSSHESANQHHFTYSGSSYSATSGAAASHVYSAAGSTKDLSRSRKSTSTGRRSKSLRSSRNHQLRHQDDSQDVNLLDEQSAEALLLGQHGLITSQSSGHSGNNSMGAFRSLSSPNYDDFAHFLEQICTPVFSNVPAHVAFDSVQAFSLVYQQHIIDLLRAVSSHEFAVVEGLSEMFWMNFPPEMLSCLHCDESLRIVAIADDYLYQVLIHTLIPDVLEPVPIGITQNVRQFSKFLEGILQRTLQSPIPGSIIEVKLDSARRFCQVLRRRTSLSHLTQAIRSILCNSEQTHQMLLDWGNIDFQGIKEQCDWIMRLKEGFLNWIEASFRTYLQDGVSLHVWSTWIENITEQCINGEQVMGASLEEACSTVILRWTFYSSMIMRDLTLRSAASFGSFHLLNLLFNEYLMYSMEKRLDDHRRSVGLMSFWPAGTINTEESVNGVGSVSGNGNISSGISGGTTTTNNNNIGINSNIGINPAAPIQQNNNFAFDDFFRKSAVLGPTSSPVTNPATRIIPNAGLGYLSSPVASKLNVAATATGEGAPVNKENSNDYNLI